MELLGGTNFLPAVANGGFFTNGLKSQSSYFSAALRPIVCVEKDSIGNNLILGEI